ncbi:MAG TPA: hypothetical protein PKC65_03240 [Pyrinomonadaceae bacterium]|nr:hypothetical protein [Pyrinomonadaceae bacterium]
MTFQWFDIVGGAGVALIIGTYLLLQFERISSDSVWYSILNALGAALIIVSLYFDFNFSAFIVEFFWLLISLFGIAKFLMRRRSAAGN